MLYDTVDHAQSHIYLNGHPESEHSQWPIPDSLSILNLSTHAPRW